MSYRQRTTSLWKIRLVHALDVVGTIGIGLLLFSEADISMLELPTVSLVTGTILGVVLAGMAYSKKLEQMYEAAPAIFIWILLTFVIMYLFTIAFAAGFTLSTGFGMVLAIVLGEISYRMA